MTHDTGAPCWSQGAPATSSDHEPLEQTMPETTDPQPSRYRQRPNEVDAIQWTGSNVDALRAFAGIDFDTIDPADRIDPDDDAQLLVEASHWVGIRPGDWVLKFEGYFVAKDDVPFRAVWEPAAVPSAPADRAALRDRIRHWRCNGDGPCGALLDAWQRCTCPGPAAVSQPGKEA